VVRSRSDRTLVESFAGRAAITVAFIVAGLVLLQELGPSAAILWALAGSSLASLLNRVRPHEDERDDPPR